MLTVALIGANREAWKYLYDTVQEEQPQFMTGDKAAYYFADGTPPGVWRGRGLAALGVKEGRVAKEGQLALLFGEGKDPLSEVQLGKKFATPVPVEERIAARVEQELDATMTTEEQTAKLESIEREELGRKETQSVAGFEFVFSPPKSVSSWWALADPEMKGQIQAAHQAAMDATLEKLETDIIRTRTGTDGIAQAHVQGVLAATFNHWDSREGDPQLHTHMLISNRVQGVDGRWRTIDSRWSLMPAVATAGAYYDTVLMDEISNRFGVEWTTQKALEHPKKYRQYLIDGQRADTPAARHQFALDMGEKNGAVKWQIDAIPQELNDEYSTRAKQVAREKDRMIAEYVKKYGRAPGASEVIRIRQRATLRTRNVKKAQSLKSLTRSWRERARKHVGDSFSFADRVRDKHHARLNDLPLWSFRQDDVDDQAVLDAAELVLHELAGTRSTWKTRNAETGALRAISAWRFRSPEDREFAARRITEVVLSQAIRLTPKNMLRTPNAFRTANGEDMFHPKARDLYTTREVWDAEERLLAAGNTLTGPSVAEADISERLFTPTGEEQRVLSPDQAAAVANIAASGRVVDVLVGPAGAGKTTSLEKLLELWQHTHGEGSVRGLAPTARAAEVLAESLKIETENTAKWLHEHRTAETRNEDVQDEFTMREGTLVIVDEASLAGTIALDTLREQAAQAGAKLLLVGDWAQLAAIDSGGAFGLLAQSRDDVAELVNLHRFKTAWEGDASKLLRLGKTSGLDPYIKNDRVKSGFEETIISQAVDAWKNDEAAGDKDSVSLLIAPQNEMVERLNTLARDWRIEIGEVDATREATIMSGVASIGDRIVTRQNKRTLRTDHDRWVKNNDEWIVSNILISGDIVAVAGEETVVLPADYCTDHVQLGYATTAHRSQGRTVDTAHFIVDSSTTRETFYVGMTRGKLANHAYVVVDSDSSIGDKSATPMWTSWRDILERAVLTKGGDLSAHDTGQEETERVTSIRQLAAEHQSLIVHELEKEHLPELNGLDLVDDIHESPYLGSVLANIRRLETLGQNPQEVIPMLLAKRELETAIDKLAVLHYRLAKHLERSELTMPKIAGIIEQAPRVGDSEIRAAIEDREYAIQLRAEQLVDQAIAENESWLEELGTPDLVNTEEWRRRATTVACFRDLYGVNGDSALGAEHANAKNRERDRKLALEALAPDATPRYSATTANGTSSPITVATIKPASFSL